MELFWVVSCSLALVLLIPMTYHIRPKRADDVGAPSEYREVRASYLIAWSLCVLADWFQGPYLYALYSSYGYSRKEIGHLFMAGFATSGICGMFVGAFADSFGRKRSAILYACVYVVSCMTKHVNNFHLLIFGRMAAGLATSLLFSVFESWLVHEYRYRHAYSQQLLSYTFSLMYILNYIVAISAGVLSQMFVEMFPLHHLIGNIYVGGGITAFDIATVILLAAGLFIHFNWEENYGQRAESTSSVLTSLADGVKMVCRDSKLILCATIVSLFESSMYILIFSWTPLLVTKSSNPPLGIVFSTFMMACAGGAAFFRICNNYGISAHSLLFVAVFIATTAMGIPNFVGIGERNVKINFFALTLFEFSIGIYFPAMSLVKSQIVQEECRATLYNIFRVPMNAIVIFALGAGLDLHSIFVLLNATSFCALCMTTLFMTTDKAGMGVGGMSFNGATSTQGERSVLRQTLQTPQSSPSGAQTPQRDV